MKKIIHSLGCKSALLYFVFSLLPFNGQITSSVVQSSTVSNSIKTKITDKSIPSLLKNGTLTESKNSESQSPLERMKGKEEDLSKRDAFSKHFKNTDGTYTAIIGTGPLHFQNKGKWEDIETKVIKYNNSLYPYVNKTNSLQSYFSGKSQQGIMTRTEEGDVKEFLNSAMYWEVDGEVRNQVLASQVSAEVKDNKVSYNNIFGRIDAEFTVLNLKRKLNYIVPDHASLGDIPANATYLVFSEDIEIPVGWNYKFDENKNVQLQNVAGKTVLIYEKPSVLENYGSEDSMIVSAESPALFEVTKNGNIIRFLLKVETKWLLAAERKFPLAIDPTVIPNNAPLWSGWANINGGNNNNLFAGFFSDGYPMVGFMRFNLTSIPDTSVIGAVQSYIYFYGSTGSMAGRQMAIVDVPKDPLTVTLYSEIANSVTQYISSDVVTINNSPVGDRVNNFSPEGLSYVQDGLLNNFVTVGAFYYNIATWTGNNYAAFYGYSSGLGPLLDITYSTTCTTPSSAAATYYINNVKFIGTLNPDTNNTSTFSTTRYSDYTALTAKAKQIPGGGINVNVGSTGGSTFLKAWVDWNNNGLYDNTERVYDTGSILTSNTIFGFVVPIGTAPGTYKIRIRSYGNSPYFPSCGALANGETEDYSFVVIADCPAKITATNINATDGRRCGAGVVTVSATGSGTSYQWYTDEFGNTPIALATSGTYTTPSLPVGTYTYYVTSKNASCESVYRTPVKVIVSPTPTVTLTQSTPSICGEAVSMSLSSSGDKEEVTLLSEKFTSGLGAFQNINGLNSNINGFWINRPSPYIPTTPPYSIIKPALSSGNDGANFASMNTDLSQTSSILNYLTLQNNLNTTGYLNLKMDFDLYYYSYIDNDETKGYLKVDYSTNGGTNWTNLTTITSDAGIPSKWSNQSFLLPASLLNQTQVKFRISVFGNGDNTGWIANIAGIDNIRVYGDKPLNTNFTWSAPNITMYNSDCTTPYSGASTAVCIKPDATQIENNGNWTISAFATLSNGCTASKSVVISNDTKVYNVAGTDWNTNGNWKPAAGTPDANKCVIIKQQSVISIGTDAFAKNVTVKSGAGLTIDGSLTVTEYVNNMATAADVVISSDASLKQISDSPVPANSGAVTAKRDIKLSGGRQQYNYVMSPLENQSLASIYKDINGNPVPVPFVLYHNESTNRFYNSTGAYIKGRGLAVKEPAAGFSPNTMVATFAGKPTNGAFTYGIVNSNLSDLTKGYNLTGNPYPSNIDLRKLYDINGGKTDPTQVTSSNISATFYFWDNNGNTIFEQQGSGYLGQSYALFNVLTGSNGTGTKASSGTKVPTKIVKVGQGFMTKSLVSSYSLNYNNSIRTTETSNIDFLGKENLVQDDRYWLKMTASSGIASTIAVVYYPGGNNLFGAEDSRSMGGSDAVYSVVENENVGIDGRNTFSDTDRISLGTQHFASGNYIFALENKEGIFANGQNIYLKDLQTGIITNLSAGVYPFLANEGERTGRFEIIYRPETVLATESLSAEQTVVYRIATDVVIKSPKTIAQIEVYDSSGKLWKQVNPNQKISTIDVSMVPHGIYILKITNKEGQVVTRKFIR